MGPLPVGQGDPEQHDDAPTEKRGGPSDPRRHFFPNREPLTHRDLSLAGWVRIYLDVRAPILLASFRRRVAVNRFIWTVAGRPQPLGGETVFFHQVFLDLVCPRV